VKFGLLVRKECWALSLRGKLLVLSVAAASAVTVFWGAYPFLATNRPIETDVLLVEGWVPDTVMNQAAAEFKHGHYRQLVVLRSSYGEAQSQYVPATAMRDYIARLLMRYGVPQESLGTLYFPAAERDRTYHAALAARDWFAEAAVPATSFNVLTEGPHARRSMLLFRKAFGNATTIGVIPLVDPRYDPKHWWRTSEGVREVTGETIAYVYAKFFFLGD
jgi:uncharacterized SAM-binding protein YcdF (DUF218 family)